MGSGACIEVADSAMVNREAEVKPEASLPRGELSPSDMAYGRDIALSALWMARAAGGVLSTKHPINYPSLIIETACYLILILKQVKALTNAEQSMLSKAVTTGDAEIPRL